MGENQKTLDGTPEMEDVEFEDGEELKESVTPSRYFYEAGETILGKYKQLKTEVGDYGSNLYVFELLKPVTQKERLDGKRLEEDTPKEDIVDRVYDTGTDMGVWGNNVLDGKMLGKASTGKLYKIEYLGTKKNESGTRSYKDYKVVELRIRGE